MLSCLDCLWNWLYNEEQTFLETLNAMRAFGLGDDLSSILSTLLAVLYLGWSTSRKLRACWRALAGCKHLKVSLRKELHL